MINLARQFGHPRGLLGAAIGHGMARGNGALSRWVVQEIRRNCTGEPERIAELGPGPGVGLEALLAQFADAHVWGIDLSPAMLRQAGRRNRAQMRAGRLTLTEGTTKALTDPAPADIVMANHVLYFWHDPEAEMRQIHQALRPGGLLAVGYQLRQNMPPMAQKRFPLEGHLLYDSDNDVTRVAHAAGFRSITNSVKGSPDAPHGRVMLATA